MPAVVDSIVCTGAERFTIWQSMIETYSTSAEAVDDADDKYPRLTVFIEMGGATFAVLPAGSFY